MRKVLGLTLLTGAFVSCDFADDADLFGGDELGAREAALGVSCRAPEVCTGGGPVYLATYRVGETATTRGELLQSFVSTLDGTPARVAIVARPLRELPIGTQSLLHLDVHEATDPRTPDLTPATLRASGTVPVENLARNGATLVTLVSHGGLVTGGEYLLRVWADGVGTAGSDVLLVGVGAVITPTYAEGAAYRRAARRTAPGASWGEARFREAGSWDVAFAFSGSAGDPCSAPDHCRVGLVCHDGACFSPNATPLAISPAAVTLATGTTQPFSASGGDLPYTFSVVSGGGTLVGASYTAPATPGAATVRVTDLLGHTSDAAVTLVPPTRVEACTGLMANAHWNTASSITQSWTGAAWVPTLAAVYATEASTTECRFACDPGHTWSGGACTFAGDLVLDTGVRRWSDGTFAASCEGYRYPSAGHTYTGATGDGQYRIDADGAGSLAAFEVWCDMTNAGGGWTLVAHHEDARAHTVSTDVLLPGEWGGLTNARWQALRARFTTGMMFFDELGRRSRISRAKLLAGNCVPLATTLQPAEFLWHHENSGCGATGTDYSLIKLTANHATSGAALYQASSVDFDEWPYSGSYSYNQQDELLYYVR